MSKKVLVLCQRKKGIIHYNDKKVEDEVVPEINSIVEKLIKTKKYTIEYLSSGDYEGEIDIEGWLEYNEILTLKNENDDEITAEDFIEKNKKSYNLIILNTCPFKFMNYTIINELLSDDGLLVYSIFPLDLVTMEKDHPLIKSIVRNKRANRLFILDKIRDDSVFIYKKKRIPGGTKKTRNLKKRARRIKNKSIKNKSIKNKSIKNKK
jgi:hypothetical protein